MAKRPAWLFERCPRQGIAGAELGSYFKLATDLTQFLPPNALAMYGGKLPEPKNEVVDGVSLSYFELPLPPATCCPTSP